MDYLKTLEKIYLKQQKEKILEFGRELFNTGEINLERLQDIYFFCNIAKNK